jgi:hypothetical protein
MVDSWHLCGGYGTAGEQPERRHEAEDRAERAALCSLVSALFLAESEKLTGQPISVCAIGKGLVDGFTVDVAAIPTPGMISRRRLGGTDLVIEGFAIHNFSLAGRLLVDSVEAKGVFL